jgi:multiple antibiotic resistance protein
LLDLRTGLLAEVEATILVFAALFPIVNPLGSAAIFLNLTGGSHPHVQRILARKIAIYGFFLLIGSLLFGAKILSFFGVSIYAVQIGGGLVVTTTGWSLLSQTVAGATTRSPTDDDILANAFYPYTLPITVGPGSISVAVTLGAHIPTEVHASSIFSPLVLIASLIGIVAICFLIYVCYRYADSVKTLLGTTGTSVLMRLSSFILLCIGVQIVATGVKAYLESMKPF